MGGQNVRDVLDTADRRWESRWVSRSGTTAPVFLAGCATTDITQPYHSHSYLAGSLNRSGHHYLVRDLGIEFWRYVIAPPVVVELRTEVLSRLRSSDVERALLLRSYAELLEDPYRFQSAWQSLTDPNSFFDLRSYLRSVKELNLLPRLLTLLAWATNYKTFSSVTPPGMARDRFNLVIFRKAIQNGIGIEVVDHFYDHHADVIAGRQPCLVGLTVPFLSQLEHSFALGWRLRNRGVDVAIGGPIAAKFYKYIDQVEDLDVLSFGATYLATGEGDTLISELAESAINGRSTAGLPNLVNLDSPQPLDNIFFEDLNTLPCPDYSVWDYDLYAAPEPGGLYSPTRGCYWNKCSFCDYGLSMNGPTSPWRTRDPDKVAADLKEAAQHIKYFFFAVDVLSPSYATRLARELIQQDVKLKWMADFRLESTFNKDMADVFKQAGCSGGAFGMESGCQEVLDSMQKGIRVHKLEQVVNSFANAAIPVQLMGFTGFPGESRHQAQQTFDLAARLGRVAATVALGKFGLTPGSDVARNPKLYNLTVRYRPGSDVAIPWELDWEYESGEVDGLAPDDFKSSLSLVRGFPYPFLGSTTTLHSLLYFDRAPRPPFSIPYWNCDFPPGEPFYIIPFYFELGAAEDGQWALQSGLTGRVVLVPAEIAAGMSEYFRQREWPVESRTEAALEVESPFLTFLVEHSLALFLPTTCEIDLSGRGTP